MVLHQFKIRKKDSTSNIEYLGIEEVKPDTAEFYVEVMGAEQLNTGVVIAKNKETQEVYFVSASQNNLNMFNLGMINFASLYGNWDKYMNLVGVQKGVSL